MKNDFFRFCKFLLCTGILLFVFETTPLNAEDGYRLWLRYDLIQDQEKLDVYRNQLKQVVLKGNSPKLTAVKNDWKEYDFQWKMDDSFNVFPVIGRL
ncbi:MAG: hypothetical protein WD035_08210 [Balneolaceae bacterium]